MRFMIIYQFSNLPQICFIVLFVILIIVSIAISIFCFPLLKMLLCNNNSIASRILLSCVCIPLYIFCITLFVLSMKNVVQYYNITKNTNLEKCDVVTGEIVELEKIPQYSRGSDLVSYHITFTIENEMYFIDKDIGVDLDNIKKWNVGEQVIVYYQTDQGKNEVIRVVRRTQDTVLCLDENP